MALDADYDVVLFAEIARSGNRLSKPPERAVDRLRESRAVEAADTTSLIETGSK